MTQLLTQGSTILAVGPFIETDDSIRAEDVIFPKHVIEGYLVVEAELPDHFQSSSYQWNGTAVVMKTEQTAPTPVPPMVTRRQARQALLLTNGADGTPLLDKVQVAINALDDGTPEGAQKKGMAQIEWDDSQDFQRSRPLLIEIAHALGLSDVQLDDLFTLAITL